jgi:hypothetical protein
MQLHRAHSFDGFYCSHRLIVLISFKNAFKNATASCSQLRRLLIAHSFDGERHRLARANTPPTVTLDVTPPSACKYTANRHSGRASCCSGTTMIVVDKNDSVLCTLDVLRRARRDRVQRHRQPFLMLLVKKGTRMIVVDKNMMHRQPFLMLLVKRGQE